MQQGSDNKQDQQMRSILRRYREDAMNTDKAWKQFAGRQGIRRSIPLRHYMSVAAAVLLLVLGFGTFYIMEQNSSEWVTITADAGQRKMIYMSDSTCVTLAAGSELRYDKKKYGKEQREVLLRGKAFFEVSRDESRTFSVNTSTTKTTVLGTSFQLKEEGDTTYLYVESGKVSFAAEEESVILTAGMSASTISGIGISSVDEKEENVNVTAWKTRQLVFNEMPLPDVINDLNDYYQVEITNTIPSTTILHLTATFADLPLEDVLYIINQTLDTGLVVSMSSK